MKTLSRLLLAALTLAALSACPSEPPPPPPEPPKPVEPPKPPEPPKPVIPPYEPTGEFAELKKGAAAGIDENNALAKATETEAALDKAIADLEAAKATKK